MALINSPPNNAVDESGTRVAQGWAEFFSNVFMLLAALTGSGTTVNRPTKFLFLGRPYFDSTLGFPVWWNGTIWVDATGTPA